MTESRTPDNWVIIKFYGSDPHYRVLCGWLGGYTTGDSWRMNSGIIRSEQTEHIYRFYGSSGSCYECSKNSYCLRNNNAHVWTQLQDIYGDRVEIMPEDTDWLTLDWIIK